MVAKFILPRLLSTCLSLSLASACFLFSGALAASQWKPLCPDGSICSTTYEEFDGPMPTSSGVLMWHFPIDFLNCFWPWTNFCLSYTEYTPSFFRLSQDGVTEHGTGPGAGPGDGYGRASVLSAIELANGKNLHFARGNRLYSWENWEDPVTSSTWHELGPIFQGQAGIHPFGPPIEVQGTLMVGMGGDSWGPGFYFMYFYRSDDAGLTWTMTAEYEPVEKSFWFGDRHNLVASPGNDSVWFIAGNENSINGAQLTSLWETKDFGSSWQRVDDGTFPTDARQVVHDPLDASASYALAGNGLYLSLDEGVSWRLTELKEPVFGLEFVDRQPPLARALVAGTSSGVKVSNDEGLNWHDMSQGLLAKPHRLTYADGQLLATSQSGYFTCEDLDCAGTSQSLPAGEDRGVVEVIEFYNTVLDHYFITGTQVEADMIDQGLAGEGWQRTGESFVTWSVGGYSNAVDVCRFYGSVAPGPNSHFYSVSAGECRFLMELQESIPDDRPRWNFEGYAFSVIPPAPEGNPCPLAAIPVFRAYNNGFAQGVDSNHRYMTDPALVEEMVQKGWVDEGVAFCSVPREHLEGM